MSRPRVSVHRDTQRFPIEFPTPQRKRIAAVAGLLNLESDSEVVRQAVSFFDEVVMATERGATIIIREPNGDLVEKTTFKR